MKKQIRKLIALFVVMSMVSSFAPASFAEGGDDMFFDFETYYPDDYFADIPGWNASATKSQFTIHSWEDDPDNESWGKSLKYTNGPYNEQARINLNGYYDTVGIDFSFCFESVSNNVLLSFRNYSGDLYALSLNSKNQVTFFGNVVASYEAGKWYDISVIFSNSRKYGRLKFKSSDSDEWEVFDGFYSGKNAVATEGVFFDFYGGAQGDGGIKYFDNMRIYIPDDEFKPSLSTYSDDFENGINYVSGTTNYTKHWIAYNADEKTDIITENLDGYEGNVLKMKDVSDSSSMVNLKLGKYPFTEASAPDVRHIMTFKLGASFNDGTASLYTKYISPSRNTEEEFNILTLKENEIVMTDVNGSESFDAKIEPDKLYDVVYIYDARAGVAYVSVTDDNGDTISNFLDLGCFASAYGYLYNIEFENSSDGENTVYVDDFFWDISDIDFKFSDAYVKSAMPHSADINETVVFEYTDIIDPNSVPEVYVIKNGENTDAQYDLKINGNKVEISFKELEKNTDYTVNISNVQSVFDDWAYGERIAFTTSEYFVEASNIFVSGTMVFVNSVSAYAGGFDAYVAVSAYDGEDNLTEVKLLPIKVPYRESQDFCFYPTFDGSYNYMKALLIKDFASAVSFSANVSEAGIGMDPVESSENPIAIKTIESDGDSFTVKGQNISKKDSIITIQTLRNDKNWEDLDGFDYENGNICEILSGFDAVSGVGYGDGYSFTLKLVDGTIPLFRIRFGDGTFAYYDSNLIENINNSQSCEEFEEIIRNDEDLLSKLESIIENLTSEEQEIFWQILFAQKNILSSKGIPWDCNSDVEESALDASVLARLSLTDSPETLKWLMHDLAYEGHFPTDSYDIFEGLGSFDEFGMTYSQKMALCSYIFNNVSTYSFAADFFEDFNEKAVLYAIKGGSASGIDKILSASDLIDENKIPTYFRLDAAKAQRVCQQLGSSGFYGSLESLYNAVERYSKAQLGSGGGGGVGGGGGGYRGFAMYMQNPDGSVIEGEPETSADVKLTIQATLITHPGVWYAVVIYDESGKMKQAEIFESEKEEIGEHEFLEIYTKYDPNAIIKILTLDGASLMKPAREYVEFIFDMCDFNIPEAEKERPGVVAYRGYVSSITSSDFVLIPDQIRSEGYWYTPYEHETMEVVYYDCDVEFCAMYSPIYNIKSVDGVYVLESIESGEYDIVEFSCDEITNHTGVGLSILKGDMETEYVLSPMCNFYIYGSLLNNVTSSYFNMKDALYTMAVSDGKVMGISVSYSESEIFKIASATKYHLKTDDETLIYIPDCVFADGIPVAGDVCEIYFGDKTIIRICESVFAEIGENGVVIDEISYPHTGYRDEGSFIVGEKCIAYMNSSKDKVVYIGKDYSSQDLLLVLDVEFSNFGDCKIRTSKGIITVTEDFVCVNGMYYRPEELAELYDYFSSNPAMYYYKTENCQVFEQHCEPIEITAKYSNGVLGQYVLTDKTIVIANCGEYGVFVDNIPLQQNYIYHVNVYSKDGVSIDIILFDDPYGQLLTKTVEMIVSENDGNRISGYSNGKFVNISVSSDEASVIRPGDYIRFTHINGRILMIDSSYNIRKHISTAMFMVSGSSSSANQLMVASVSDVIGGTVITEIDGIMYTGSVNDSTLVYMFDMSEDTLVQTDISELTFDDIIFAKLSYGVVTTLVIYRE